MLRALMAGLLLTALSGCTTIQMVNDDEFKTQSDGAQAVNVALAVALDVVETKTFMDDVVENIILPVAAVAFLVVALGSELENK